MFSFLKETEAVKLKLPVVPICENQRKDVRPEHIIAGGLVRLCDVYKGGGGYDKFPAIAKKRLGIETGTQLVVQLKGCPLKCPYCYVTPDGIHGKHETTSIEALLLLFNGLYVSKGVKTFHLMGGAPALYLDHWPIIAERLPEGTVFHSDLLLIEQPYKKQTLQDLAKTNSLLALSIKGNDSKEFLKNTGTTWERSLFWHNFNTVVDSGVNFYITYTGIKPDKIEKEIKARYGASVLEDSFTIDLVEYDALK